MKKPDFSLIFTYIYILMYFTMKKTHLIIWLFTTLLFLWLVKWASSWLIDFINNLWENIEFGYITDTVDVSDITTAKVTFQSPFILDWSWNKITKYRIMYSPKSLDEMEADTNLLSQSMEKQFNITNTSGSTFTMDLIAPGDQLVWDNIYYALVIPEANNWIFGELSNEICFKLSTRIYGEWNDCVNWNWTTPENDHNAWWADMSLANISFTRNWNTITLRWISIEWSDEVEIFLRDRDNEEYKKLWTADIDDEEYAFTTNENWEHRVKFIPDNGWTEHIYTFQVTWISWWSDDPDEPWIPKVPKVWPTENTIAIIVFTLAIYFIYRRSRRHS